MLTDAEEALELHKGVIASQHAEIKRLQSALRGLVDVVGDIHPSAWLGRGATVSEAVKQGRAALVPSERAA